MAMTLRDKNYVSEIKHISVVQNSIVNMIEEDVYYFSTTINAKTRVYYIKAIGHVDGVEFVLYRDLTTYASYNPSFAPASIEGVQDEVIKVITNSNDISVAPTITSVSTDPAQDMAFYVTTYLDALQTTDEY